MQIKLFAKCVGISRTAVYNAFERGKLDRTGNEGVDLLGKRTAAYLVGYGLTGPQVEEIAAGTRPVPQPRKARLVTPAARKRSPAGKPLSAKAPSPPPATEWKPPTPPSAPLTPKEIGTRISDEGLFTQDADVLQKVLAAEKILDVRQTRAVKRGELIKRDLVKHFISGIVGVHRAELGSMGAKLAPEILSACGLTDESLMVSIERTIDENAYRILEHIQRQIKDFLKKLKVEEAEEDE